MLMVHLQAPIKREPDVYSPAANRRRSARPGRGRELRFAVQSGFTVTELVVVLILTGVLAAVAAPLLSTAVIDEARFYTETQAFLRYAQKTAVAQRRNVCLSFTATTVSATVATSFGGACSGALTGPGGVSPYAVIAQKSAGFSATPVAITFNANGVPNNPQTLLITGSNAIVVEAGSGYVH